MFNPSVASNRIREEFLNYILTSYSINHEDFEALFESKLASAVSKGPIIEMTPVFKTGKSIIELINEGILHQELSFIESKKPQEDGYEHKLPLHRPLYSHQEKAIRKFNQAKNLVVSTGTGSGKTESFLIPILNSLAEERANGTLTAGVRAIFIYPMNALANDQLKRIREILMYYPYITFGVYNGATEHQEKKAEDLYKAMFYDEQLPELRKPLSNEILSREVMQKTPPNILFTNYAMLEHMLLRPNDGAVFNSANFKYVVLDEAHVYNGATGMETAMLMRRLKARINNPANIQFVLTSATLGSSIDSNKDIIRFAENLTNEKFEADSIIRAERHALVFNENLEETNRDLIIELATEKEDWFRIFDKYNIKYDKKSDHAEVIYDYLSKSNDFAKLTQLLSEPKEVNELVKYFLNEQYLISLIHVASGAQKNGKMLINARYHFFLRALEGMYISFLPKYELTLVRTLEKYHNEEKIAVFESSTCSNCGSLAVVGKQNERKLDLNIPAYKDCDHYYLNFEDDDDLFEINEESDEINLDLIMCKKCASIATVAEMHNPPCDCIKNHGIKVVKSNKDKCPGCGNGTFERFYLGNDVATSVISISLYDQLPTQEAVIKKRVTEDNSSNPFLKLANLDTPKVETRDISKQFLIFSDSRQSAAYFSSYLSNSYKQFMRRRGFYWILKRMKPGEGVSVKQFVDRLANLFSQPGNKSFFDWNQNENIDHISRKQAWLAVLDEIVNQNRKTSLHSLGYVSYDWIHNEPLSRGIHQNYNLSLDQANDFVRKFFNSFISQGAVDIKKISEIDMQDREHIFFSTRNKVLVKEARDDDYNTVRIHFRPKFNNKGKPYKTYRYNMINQLTQNSEKTMTLLENFWGYYSYANENRSEFAIKLDEIMIYSHVHEDANAYQCNKCYKVTQYNIDGKCSRAKCEGKLENVNINEIHKNNHFIDMYQRDQFNSFIVREHTAQLSKQESLDYQKAFVEKKINALSCSTTFEMGVDVGSLETVFLRNVPPLPSNYAQRAGRAGRSKNAAAFAITYAQLSSHDFNYFARPLQMIKGVIMPPIFSIDNDKVVKRHIYAVALSFFLKQHPEEYNKNKISKFIEENGFVLFDQFLRSQPNELKQLLKKSFPEASSKYGLDDFSWVDGLTGEEGVLKLAIDNHNAIKRVFTKAINEAIKNEQRLINSLNSRLRNHTNQEFIEFFAKNNILPRYGFPIDSVELHQYNSSNSNSNYKSLNLSRDLQIAIAEYAPGAEIVADGGLYTSRYIRNSVQQSSTSKFHVAYVYECNFCKTINHSYVERNDECIGCKKAIKKGNWETSIEPRGGFISEDIVKPVPMSKPEKVYRTDAYFIDAHDRKPIRKVRYYFNDATILVESAVNDALLVKTTSYFYTCNNCGYSKNADEVKVNNGQPFYDDKNKHVTSYSKQCGNLRLYKNYLHHVFRTDAVKIVFENSIREKSGALSVLNALLDAMALVLDIERRDIKGTIHYQKLGNDQNYTFIIYDGVPGGVGHTKRLLDSNGDILRKIFAKAIEKTKNCTCDPSCYMCIRNYSNKEIHEVLNRHDVYNFLEIYEQGITYIEEINIEKETVNFEFLSETFKSIENWDELLEFAAEGVYDALVEMRNSGMEIPDLSLGKMMINESIVPVEAVWTKDKIIAIDTDDQSLINQLKAVNWRVINNTLRNEEKSDG